MGDGGSADDHRLSAIGYRLSAIGYRLSVIGYRLSVIGYRLSAIGYKNRGKHHTKTAAEFDAAEVDPAPRPEANI